MAHHKAVIHKQIKDISVILKFHDWGGLEKNRYKKTWEENDNGEKKG